MIHALSGGVGGAKLAVGLAKALDRTELTIVVNTADDFDYLGLHIMPDLDSVLYALKGLNDAERGWGRAGETWHCKEALIDLGVDAWFSLGDRDLAIHILRTSLMREGASLTEVTRELLGRMALPLNVVPMSDERVSTVVLSDGEEIAFQEYFVRLKCDLKADGFRFDGADSALPAAGWFDRLASQPRPGIIFCPSNPYLSIDPILALRGVREVLKRNDVPVVAVSPIVGGKALKGPLAKIMADFGVDPSPLAIADHYSGLLDGLVIDRLDAQYEAELRRRGLRVAVCDTIMKNAEDSRRLADIAIGLLVDCGMAHA
jgi:LPPG:FO 2-phospho-L-lactate transferase